MTNRFDLVILPLACSLFSTVPAIAAPPQALNKTVILSFATLTPAHCDNGRDNETPRNTTHRVYISTKGRLFAEMSAVAAGRRTYSRDNLAEPSASSPFHFSGNKLIATFSSVSGARQETISFDPSFSRCTADVVFGRDSGKPYTWMNLAGHKCTATGKHQVSNVSCSVSEGNAFAR